MAPPAPPKKKRQRQKRDIASARERTEEKERKEKTYAKAVKWCIDNECKARKAFNSGLFEGVTYSTLKRRLADHKADARKASKSTILTEQEEKDLVEWMQEKNREHGGVGRQAVCVKICQMLELRRTMRRLNFDRKYDALSANAITALNNGGPSECSPPPRTLPITDCPKYPSLLCMRPLAPGAPAHVDAPPPRLSLSLSLSLSLFLSLFSVPTHRQRLVPTF